MKVNRLELLKAQINLELMAGFDDIQHEMERDLIQTAMKEDRRLAGILGDSVIGNEEYAKQLVNASFRNATFSERIWGRTMPDLRIHLEAELRNGLVQGIGSDELARRFRKHYGGSIRDTERLMTTEMCRLQTAVQKESFERNGYMQAGVNAPPMHPRCHCSVAGYMDSDKYKRWIDALANGEDVRWNEFEAEDIQPIPTGAPIETYRKKKRNTVDDDLQVVNPGYPKDKARRLNCQRCVPAYELRKRKEQLDVIARPATLDKNGRLVYDEAMKQMLNVFVGAKENLRPAGSFDGKDFIEKQMLRFEDGARAQVFVTWKEGTEKYVRNGKVVELPKSHTFVAENNNGIIRFVDPQNGKEDCSDYFTKVKNGCTMFVRIDKLPINEDIIDLFITNRGG